MKQRIKLERIWEWHKFSIITMIACAVVICAIVAILFSLPPDPLTTATVNHDCKGIRAYAEAHIQDVDEYNQAEKAMKLEGCM